VLGEHVNTGFGMSAFVTETLKCCHCTAV